MNTNLEIIDTSLNNADIQTFNLNKISKNKTFQYQLGSSLLNEYLRGNLKASDIFDISCAKYFALTDLLQILELILGRYAFLF